MSLRIIAPIHFLYENPRHPLPRVIELEKNLRITNEKRVAEPVIDFVENLYSRDDIQELKNCHFWIVYDFDPTEKETKDDAQQKVHRVIETLRIIRPTNAACTTFIFSKDNQGNLHIERASQKSSTIFLIYGETPDSTDFKTEDAEKIKEYYSYVSKLYKRYGGSYSRVLNSFIFFQLGYLIGYAKLRIVPFTIALESLFNTSEQEVGYSLRMRCASFLGENKAEKEELIRKIKKIYELRSRVVHGSSLPNKVLKDPLQSNEIIRDAEAICRRCLQKIFEKNLDGFFSTDRGILNKNLDEFLLN